MNDAIWIKDFLPNGKKTLVITSCSSRKKHTTKKIDCYERYNGQLFNMIKKFVEKNQYDLLILSAKYGLLKPKDKINYYNKKIRNKEDIILLKKKYFQV
ncbi:MAG: DUF6884 domain-containing protein [Promethearchaeota archaeon]